MTQNIEDGDGLENVGSGTENSKKKCINAMKIEKPSDFSSKVAEDDKKTL